MQILAYEVNKTERSEFFKKLLKTDFDHPFLNLQIVMTKKEETDLVCF